MGNLISIDCDGDIHTHIVSQGNYSTLCGIDGYDDHLTSYQRIVKLQSDKVDCCACITMWNRCREIKPKQIKQD